MTDDEARELIKYACLEMDHQCNGEFCTCPCHLFDVAGMARYRELARLAGGEKIERRFTPEAREILEKWKQAHRETRDR